MASVALPCETPEIRSEFFEIWRNDRPPRGGDGSRTALRRGRSPRGPKPKAKNYPKLIAAAHELRDRWLEHVNEAGLMAGGKYDVSRTLGGAEPAKPLALLPAA